MKLALRKLFLQGSSDDYSDKSALIGSSSKSYGTDNLDINISIEDRLTYTWEENLFTSSTRLFLFLIEFHFVHATGSIEEQEYYTDILLGIKQVIQCHLKDLQGRFQDKFVNLEMEVRRRDEVINQLQNRLREFEPGDRMTPINERDMSGSTGSSNELPFMVSLEFIAKSFD